MLDLRAKIGFTLIEMLVVIAVVTVLASVVLVAGAGFRESARDDARRVDLKEIQLALETYYQVNNQYPDTLSDIPRTILPNVPVDPSTDASYTYTPTVDSGLNVGYTITAEAEADLSPGDEFYCDDGDPESNENLMFVGSRGATCSP